MFAAGAPSIVTWTRCGACRAPSGWRSTTCSAALDRLPEETDVPARLEQEIMRRVRVLAERAERAGVSPVSMALRLDARRSQRAPVAAAAVFGCAASRIAIPTVRAERARRDRDAAPTRLPPACGARRSASPTSRPPSWHRAPSSSSTCRCCVTWTSYSTSTRSPRWMAIPPTRWSRRPTGDDAASVAIPRSRCCWSRPPPERRAARGRS